MLSHKRSIIGVFKEEIIPNIMERRRDCVRFPDNILATFEKMINDETNNLVIVRKRLNTIRAER